MPPVPARGGNGCSRDGVRSWEWRQARCCDRPGCNSSHVKRGVFPPSLASGKDPGPACQGRGTSPDVRILPAARHGLASAAARTPVFRSRAAWRCAEPRALSHLPHGPGMEPLLPLLFVGVLSAVGARPAGPPSPRNWERILVEGSISTGGCRSRSGGSCGDTFSDEVQGEMQRFEGENVVLNEFAHQLDQEDGVTDGTPVLGDGTRSGFRQR